MAKKCNTCGGIYEPNQGNYRYFHACAPVFNSTTKVYDEKVGKLDENIIDTPTVTKTKTQTGTIEKSNNDIKAPGTGTIDV
jgi:hypothetical protein